MSTRKKAPLGRGLSAMLERSADEQAHSTDDRSSLRELPLDRIQPGRYQPRGNIDPQRLEELADSIRSQGVVQPVVVRPLEAGGYELIAGERRWRAAQQAGLETRPAVIREVSDEITVAMALIENIQREDLNPLEEANALRRLIHDFEMTHGDAAKAVGRSRAAVSNLLRLLELETEVRELVDQGRLDMGHARALLGLTGRKQVEAAHKVVKRGLSVRATEKLVQDLLKGNSGKPQQTKPDPNIQRLERDLADHLGATVSIRHQSSGKGQLRIGYHSLDELEGILERLR